MARAQRPPSSGEGEKTPFDQALERALRFIDYRPRSMGEVRDRLKRYGYDRALIDEVVEYLTDARILDDGAFASLYVEELVRKDFGILRVRSELAKKRISRETADSALEDYPYDTELDRAMAAARRKISTVSGEPAESGRKKIIDVLRRRGFPPKVASDAARMTFQVDTQTRPELEC